MKYILIYCLLQPHFEYKKQDSASMIIQTSRREIILSATRGDTICNQRMEFSTIDGVKTYLSVMKKRNEIVNEHVYDYNVSEVEIH